MGQTYANVKVTNGDDVAYLRKGLIGEDEVRQMEVRMLADTGAIMLCLNEEIKNALGLPHLEMRPSRLVNGEVIYLEVVGPVYLDYMERRCTTNAIILPDDEEPLLGAIPLEEMDLNVAPNLGQVVPAHQEGLMMSLKGLTY